MGTLAAIAVPSMDGVKLSVSCLSVLSTLVSCQQSSGEVIFPSTLEEETERQEQASDFQSLLGRLISKEKQPDPFLTSFSTSAQSFGSLGPSLPLPKGSLSPLTSEEPSFSLPFLPSQLPIREEPAFAIPKFPSQLLIREEPAFSLPKLPFPTQNILTSRQGELSNNQGSLSSLFPGLLPVVSEESKSSAQTDTQIAALDAEINSLNSLILTMKKLARQKAAINDGGIDFSQATRTSDGRLCVIKQEMIDTLKKDPVLECKHKNVEKCHYTYLTQFNPTQEEECHENFEKSCQIIFRQEARRDSIRKCYRPLQKVCNGQGPQICKKVFESSCSTRYVEKEGDRGKFLGETSCQKLPVDICGAGCVTEEGPEECHNKAVDSLVEVPEETCDLNPQKTCSLVTKLVPSLEPKRECTIVPQETCNLKFSKPRIEKKPLQTEWCLDETNGADISLSQAIQPRIPVTTTPAPSPNALSPLFEFPQDNIPAIEAPAQALDEYTIEELRRFKRLGLF